MEHLGRYQILAEVGRGGMGIVYRAADSALGRTVAIKAIRLSEQGTPEEAQQLRERLQREARAAGSLSHPNVVTVHDIGQEGDIAYIVMEFVEGRTLEDLLAESAVPVPEALYLRVLEDAARGLDYAHAHGIVHRDVKPANILIQQDGTAKVGDFGIAKVAFSRTMTETGMLVGSPHYMAPEQLKGERVTGRTDQFALGAVAYTLLAGRKPFDGDTFATLASKILFEEPPSPLASNPRLPPEAARVLAKAMSKDPALRFENCTEFVRALQSACGRSEPEVSTLTVPVPLPKPGRRWGRWAVAAALLLVVAAAGTYFAIRRRQVAQLVIAPPPATAKTVPPAPSGPKAPEPGPPKIVVPSSRALGQQVNPNDGLVYVKVPAATFLMGCSPQDKDCYEEEKPAHRVTLTGDFWIGQTEVTVAAYKHFVEATGAKMPPSHSRNRDWNDLRQAMTNMRYWDAAAYCRCAGGRLPTEAEWEYAARAGNPGPRHSEAGKSAWFERQDGDRIHPPSLKAPNGFGLYDMLGNVSEWCQGFLDPYSAEAQTDPRGAAAQEYRVRRGGSFSSSLRAMRASFRYHSTSGPSDDGGFRCVLPANAPPPAKPPVPPLQQRTGPKDGLVYVKLPAGTFRMGCSPGDKECRDDEEPAHSVTLSRAFWIGRTEVTVEAFQRYMQAAGRPMPRWPRSNPGWLEVKQPIELPNWDDAEAYCQWAGGRLPTEAEWEYTARAGSTGPRYGDLDEVAWWDSSGGDKAQPVGLKPPNAFGLYDMLGNAGEWCRDFWEEYLPVAVTDPTGPASGKDRVRRGGDWQTSESSQLRASHRGMYGRYANKNGYGMRCVLPAE